MKKKNVVIIGINYYPEDTAIGLYTTQKARYLAENGYNVQIITGFPYYPQWEIWSEYKNKSRWTKEESHGITIFRFKQYVPSNPTFSKRILHLLSFTLGSMINLLKVSRPEIVITIVPFTSSILLGYMLKLRYRSKLWVHIQDFEFDAAVDSGLLDSNKSKALKLLLYIEKTLLKKADVISTISNSMLKKLKEKTNRNGWYLTNWLDTEVFEKNHEQHHYLKSTNFKILYSGNIGKKQDWEFFLDFLQKIQEIENVEVIVVGQGALKEDVLEKTKSFDFVKHFDPVPFEELPKLLSSADLHILFQKDGVVDTVMPSKILGMMGSARPSIITGNIESEVGKIVMESQGGFYFESNQMNEIIETVNELKNNPKRCEELGKNAKHYVIHNYGKDKVLNGFLSKLNTL